MKEMISGPTFVVVISSHSQKLAGPWQDTLRLAQFLSDFWKLPAKGNIKSSFGLLLLRALASGTWLREENALRWLSLRVVFTIHWRNNHAPATVSLPRVARGKEASILQINSQFNKSFKTGRPYSRDSRLSFHWISSFFFAGQSGW